MVSSYYQSLPLAPEDICRQPAMPQSCAVNDTRKTYHFNQEWKTCDVSQDGCLEHLSDFKTKLDCLQICSGKTLRAFTKDQDARKFKKKTDFLKKQFYVKTKESHSKVSMT